MQQHHRVVVWVSAVLLTAAVAGCGYAPRVDAPRPAGGGAVVYTDEPYARVLDAAVVGGMVDYPAISGDVDAALDRYLAVLAATGPQTTPEAFPSEQAALAYHLNAYNAFMLRKWMLEGAADAEPGDRVGWLTWFTTAFWRMDGGRVSMDYLEQWIIRPRYDDGRIHAALVCGAVSCPPLRDEPFTGENLDAQLDDQMRQWLKEPDGLRIDDDGKVYLSAIFKWYRGDFDDMGGLTGMLERYLDRDDPRREAALAAARAGELRFMGYDWSINLPARGPAGRGSGGE